MMKIEDLWQSIEKEEEKNSSFFIRRRGKIVQVAHTTTSTLLLNALSFRIVREMMLGCRHLLLQLIKKLFPLFKLFVFYKSEKNTDMYIVRKAGYRMLHFSLFKFSRQLINMYVQFKIQLNIVKI